MSRRISVAPFASAVVIAISFMTLGASAHERPNVVLILADDLGWTDLGCFGSDFYQTPNIDQLVADGTKFTNSYSACNACSPTRGALMTGMYPARTHLTDWIPGWKPQYSDFKLLPPKWTRQLEHKYTTIAEAMRDAGYKTFHLGKWHLGNQPFFPQHQGFDVNIGGSSRGLPTSYYFPYGGEAMQWDSVLPESKREGRYLTDRLADEAVELIERHSAEPFFMYFASYAVHSPIEGRADLIEKYKNLPKGKRHHNPAYAAMIEGLDEAVGRIRAQLVKSGIADRTLIIFTSDNGSVHRRISDNSPLRGEKGQHWEGGVRVPAVVHWPGVTQPGSVCNEPTITMDYYPTILEITGATGDSEHNAQVDGMTLTPLLKDPQARLDRDALYWHYPHYNPFVGIPYSSVRARDYKLIEYHEDGHIELYNLVDDLGEQHDLAREEPEVAARLQRQLHDYLDRMDAQMPVPNPEYIGKALDTPN